MERVYTVVDERGYGVRDTLAAAGAFVCRDNRAGTVDVRRVI